MNSAMALHEHSLLFFITQALQGRSVGIEQNSLKMNFFLINDSGSDGNEGLFLSCRAIDWCTGPSPTLFPLSQRD